MLEEQLVSAAEVGDLARVLDVLQKLQAEALVVAAEYGHLEVVQCLLDRGQTTQDCLDKALYIAAWNGHTEVVRCLLSRGANTNVSDESEVSVLMRAAEAGHLVIVQVLLDAGADILSADWNGSTAIINASHNGHIEVLRCLLDRGADLTAVDNDNESCLSLARDRHAVSFISATLMRNIRQFFPVMEGFDMQKSKCSMPLLLHVVTGLPDDIYRCIQAFTPINALLNTSKQLVDVKWRLYHWNLSLQYSILYHNCPEYRELFQSNGRLLQNEKKQLHLDNCLK